MTVMPVLTAEAAQARRMASLLLTGGGPASAAAVATHVGALQAQELGSGLWSLGVRLPGHTIGDVSDAFNRAEVVRTWPMRGTIHVVPAVDAGWMLELTGVRALRSAAKRHRELELDDRTLERAVAALTDALTGTALTRAQCIDILVAAGVHSRREHGYRLLWYAAHIGAICMGPMIGDEQAWVRLDEWVPRPVHLDRDAARAELALRYVRGHGPVTATELSTWSGLTLTDARAGIADASEHLAGCTVEGVVHHVDPMVLEGEMVLESEPTPARPVLLLPGFDEYVLGYRDRSWHGDAGLMQIVVPGGNGVFRATVVADGTVAGTWQRARRGGRITVTATLVRAFDACLRAALYDAADEYAAFLGRPVDVSVIEPSTP